MKHTFDVIVVGGGHAGTEAALAAARAGANTLLVTQKKASIGQMSCNPSIGGIGKGHLAKEVDAMGGAMARAADLAGIHFRTLNASKGPAVRATRAQADRKLYAQAIQTIVAQQPNLSVVEASIGDLIIDQAQSKGVVTEDGEHLYAPTVVLTVGTFLGGMMHIGDQQRAGGREGDAPSNKLAARLRELPFRVERLKTGTPPRIDGRSVNYEKTELQPSDSPRPVFSWRSSAEEQPRQIDCYITHTTERTHDIIRAALHRSAMYSGAIEGVGPRYCPSIEDKVVRFADKASHQIFIEPEGLDTDLIYPNGISTSLPLDVQTEFVHSMIGFEQALITQAGYAIEYDFFNPQDLRHSLETKFIDGLFFAGQINGTTGYEEAAAQGLLAGINAARKVANLEPWWPRRDQAYLGVLVDDLITQGTLEPYRMFTSRAEYRLQLREDNADLRLTEIGRELAVVGDDHWQSFSAKRERLEKELERMARLKVKTEHGATAAIEWLRRPDADYHQMMAAIGEDPCADRAVVEQILIRARYDGYIKRQQQSIDKLKSSEAVVLPRDLDYLTLSGLSTEVAEKLDQQRPQTLGQAGRIPGVTPTALNVLLVHLKQLQRKAS